MATTVLNQNMAIRDTTKSARSLLLGGAISGIVAGLLMAMVAMMTAYLRGMGFFLPTKLIGATFLGVDSIIGGAGAITLGVTLHMIMSAVLGIIFAFMTNAIDSAGTDLIFGLFFGVAIWAAMTYFGLPLFNDVMKERVALTPVSWFVNHLVFGAGLALTPYFEQATARNERKSNGSTRLARA